MVLSMNRYGSCKVITISAQEGGGQTAVLLTTSPYSRASWNVDIG